MRLNGEFIVRQVADEVLALPTGDTAFKLNGMIMLNEVSLVIWKCLEHDTDMASIVQAVTEQFDVSATQAQADIEAFVDQLRKANLLIE